MSIVYLLLASLFEAAWVVSLRFIDGMNNALAIITTLLFLLLSVYFLHKAATNMSIVIAYSLWVGLGIVALLLIDYLIFKQPLHPGQFFGCLLMALGIATIKMYQ
ncbi:MAG: DMT family transporter [Aestuariibacter sp.]